MLEYQIKVNLQIGQLSKPLQNHTSYRLPGQIRPPDQSLSLRPYPDPAKSKVNTRISSDDCHFFPDLFFLLFDLFYFAFSFTHCELTVRLSKAISVRDNLDKFMVNASQLKDEEKLNNFDYFFFQC